MPPERGDRTREKIQNVINRSPKSKKRKAVYPSVYHRVYIIFSSADDPVVLLFLYNHHAVGSRL